jgi:hypothetical protein
VVAEGLAEAEGDSESLSTPAAAPAGVLADSGQEGAGLGCGQGGSKAAEAPGGADLAGLASLKSLMADAGYQL